MPLALASLFYVAFGGLDASFKPSPVKVAVVDDSAYRALPSLAATVEATSTEPQPYLDPVYVPDVAAAESLVNAGDIAGFIAVDPGGRPEYHRDWREALSTNPNHEIVTAVLDSYLQNAALAAEQGTVAPEAKVAFTRPVQLTAKAPSDQVRYFYSALGFSTLMTCSFAVSGLARLRARRSPSGARVAAAGRRRIASAASAVAAAYLLSFGTLTLGYFYMRLALGVAFGGGTLQILAILAVGALSATALGCAITALPLPEGALAGVIAAVACVLSVFAGLYGPGSQDLARRVAESAPWTTWLNPAQEIYQAFFSLYCYDSFGPAALILGKLACLAAVLFGLAGLASWRTTRRPRQAVAS
jgi:hypothetical protein